MNRQEMKTESTSPRREQMPSYDRPPHAGRKKPSSTLLSAMRAGMLILGALILAVGLLLLILPMFRVKQVEVVGNSYYAREVIIAAAGIEDGEELLVLDYKTVSDRILDSCDYVEEVSVRPVYPSTVRITVTERKNMMYTEFNGAYFTLDRNFNVVERSENEADFADYLRVTLPEISSLSVGGKISFANTELDLGYITELLDVLEKEKLLDSVTSLDLSKKYSVSYVMNGQCRVELGKVGDMDVKLELVEKILSLKATDGASYAVVDVSNLQKPTYRLVSQTEMLSR